MGVGCTLQASSGLAGSRSQVPITHDLLGADSKLVQVTGNKYSRKGWHVSREAQLPVTKYDVEIPKALSDLVVLAKSTQMGQKDGTAAERLGRRMTVTSTWQTRWQTIVQMQSNS